MPNDKKRNSPARRQECSDNSGFDAGNVGNGDHDPTSATVENAENAMKTTSIMSTIVMAEMTTPQEAEMKALADKLATTYRQMVDDYRLRLKIDAAQAEAQVQQKLLDLVLSEQDIYTLQTLPPQQMDWYRLTALAERDPQLMLFAWQAINQAALDVFQCGYRAARAVQTATPAGDTPWGSVATTDRVC